MKVLELKQSQLQRVLAFGLLALTVYAVFISHTKMLVQIQSGPHLPATGLNVLPSFIEDVARLAMAWIVLLAASALAFALVRGETKKFMGPGFFVFGISSLTVQLLTTEGRLVFSYFPAFASIGLGAAVVVRTAIGLGWWNYDDPELGRYVFHVGREPGYSSIMLLWPERELGVVVVCNGMHADDAVWNVLGPGIGRIVMGL